MGARRWVNAWMGRSKTQEIPDLPRVPAPELTGEPPQRDDLVSHLTREHRDADGLWAVVEAAAEGKGDLPAAFAAFDRFTRAHLALEEEVLFVELEDRTGMHGMGPTQVMRMEHEQIRALLATIAEGVATGNGQEVLDQGDTLMVLTQQHNMKEEGMLYPMAAQVLGNDWPALRERLERYHDGPS